MCFLSQLMLCLMTESEMHCLILEGVQETFRCDTKGHALVEKYWW